MWKFGDCPLRHRPALHLQVIIRPFINHQLPSIQQFGSLLIYETFQVTCGHLQKHLQICWENIPCAVLSSSMDSLGCSVCYSTCSLRGLHAVGVERSIPIADDPNASVCLYPKLRWLCWYNRKFWRDLSHRVLWRTKGQEGLHCSSNFQDFERLKDALALFFVQGLQKEHLSFALLARRR